MGEYSKGKATTNRALAVYKSGALVNVNTKLCLLDVKLQLYRKVCTIVIPFLASHIDTTVLADVTYELIPESKGGDQEAQVNAAH